MMTRISKHIHVWSMSLALVWPVPGLLAAAPGSVLWTLDSEAGFGGHALGVEGMIYFIGNTWISFPTKTKSQLWALSESGHQALWNVPLPESPWEMSAGPDGAVYVSVGNSLIAYEASGSLLFRYTPADAIRVTVPCIGSDGSLYVVVFGEKVPQSSTLVCLSAKGSPIWSAPFPGFPGDRAPFGAPSMDADGSLYLVSDQHLVSFTNQGAIRWRFNYPGTAQVLLGEDGTAYIMSSKGFRPSGVYALNPLTMNPYGERKWFRPESTSYHQNTMSAIGPSGALYSGLFDPGALQALDRNGALLWHFELAEGSPGNYSIAVGHDGTVYMTGLTRFYAISQSGKLRWSIEFEDRGSLPILISKSGAVYFTSMVGRSGRSRLWAVDTGLKAPVHPWPVASGDYRRSGRGIVVEPKNQFSRSRLLPDNRLELLIEGPPSHLYSIERSSNLKDWQSFTNGASSNGAVSFIVPAPASATSGFYRVARP